jgi:hypothetical protein
MYKIRKEILQSGNPEKRAAITVALNSWSWGRSALFLGQISPAGAVK